MTQIYELKPFEYLKPRTLREALDLLEEMREGRAIIAGGTEVVICLKTRQMNPQNIIDISGLKELDFIKEDQGSLRIGALTTHSALEKSSLVRRKASVLQDAASQIGSVQVRNIGTIGGNIVNASPAADTAPPLLVLGATLRLLSSSQERTIPIDCFFTGVKKTIMEQNELLTEISLPKQPLGTATFFMKVGRRAAHDLSVVSAAVAIQCRSKKCVNARIAFGAVAPTPIRATRAEDYLKNKRLTNDNIKKASEIASQEILPISDIRSSADYRRSVSKALVRMTIQKALDRISR